MTIKSSRIVVVTGGRDYRLSWIEKQLFFELLRALGATALYHGGAFGVDEDAGKVAESFIPVYVFYPDYNSGTTSAPKRRNLTMLQTAIDEVGKENVVLVVFPGGGGTSHAFESAIGLGIQCIDLSALRRCEE